MNLFANTQQWRLRPWASYLVACAAAGLALGASLAFESLIQQDVYPIFLVAVLISAYIGGLGPGLLAALLATLISTYFFLPPRYSFAITQLSTLARLLSFALVALGIGSLVGMLRRAEREAFERQSRWESTLLSIGDAVITADIQGHVTFLNPVAERLTGWIAAEAYGRNLDTVFRIIREDTREPAENPVVRALREGVVVGLANHTLLIARDGSERPIDDCAAPICDQHNTVRGAVLVFRDIAKERRRQSKQAQLLQQEQESRTKAERAQQRLLFLADASRILASSLDYEQTIKSTARLAVKQLADICVIDLVQAHGMLRRAALVTADPTLQPLADELSAFTPPAGAQSGAPFVARTGQPQLFNDITDDMLAHVAQNARHLEILRSMHMCCSVVAPLLVRKNVIGTLTLTRTHNTMPFDEDDVTLAIELSQRAAQAIENARLYRAMQAEAAQRSALETDFRATFEQAAVGIAHVAPDGRWIAVNQRLCDMLGYTRAELLASSFQAVTYSLDLDADLENVRELLSGARQTYSMEKRYRRKNGMLFWINLTVSLVRTDTGEPNYFISVIEDIQARKQAEAERDRLLADLEQRVSERTADLQNVVDDLNTFTYTISHDLRAPLRALQGFGDALLEDYNDRLPHEGQEYIRHIVGAAEQMDQLLQDLLAYSRFSRADLQLQPINLGNVVEHALEQVADQIEQHHAHVTVDMGMPEVIGHYMTLVHIIANLLTNAVKFSVRDVEPQVYVWAEQRANNTRLLVRDQGIGIDSADFERIFQVFERLHGSETYQGTGIGLAIVRKGIERMGGRAGVISKLGEGSTFWIELPSRENA